MTSEEEFRVHEKNRKDLRAMLNSGVFKKAVEVLMDNRRSIEYAMETVALGASELVSVRLQSQRVGMEAFLNGLHQLTEPIAPVQAEQPPDYGEQYAADKLRELGISI